MARRTHRGVTMKKLLVVLVAVLLSGCASLGNNQLTPQGEQAILALIQIATGVAAGTSTVGGAINGTCAQLATIQPVGSCTPSASQDPAALQAAINACLAYSAETAVIFRIQSKFCSPIKTPTP